MTPQLAEAEGCLTMQDPADVCAETSDLLYEAVPEFRDGIWQLLSCEVSEELERRGRRLVFCRVTYRAELGQPTMAHLVVKVCGPSRGGVAAEALQQLAEAGFRLPSVDLVPQLYGHEPRRGTLVQSQARGITWRAILASDPAIDPAALPAASARAAEWLARLHHTSASVVSYGKEDSLISEQRMSEELLAAFPRRPALAAALDAFRANTPNAPNRREHMALSHGDFHPGQVLLDGHRVTVLDFDTFGLREAAFDVGYCIAQLLAMSYFQLRDFAPGAIAARAFWAAYPQGAGMPWSRVRFHVARGFIQILHYARRGLAGRRPEMLTLWPSLITQCLASDGPDILPRIARSL